MIWALAALAVAVIAVAAVAASGRLGELPPVVDDRPAPALPNGPLTAAGLRDVQFAVVPMGYEMSQVDAVLDRVREQWPLAPGATAEGAEVSGVAKTWNNDSDNGEERVMEHGSHEAEDR